MPLVYVLGVELTLGQEDPVATTPSDFNITAVRIEEDRIKVDGELDEAEWDLAEPATDFIQNEPLQGRPATEQTEVRVLYDANNLYVGAYCFDSESPHGLVAKELTRDFSPRDSDVFHVVLDTFNDNRNSVGFGTNPGGAKRDLQSGGDGQRFNRDWDAIWHVRTKVTDEGWQAEFAIPFRSLRFRPAEEQVWGINFDRRVRRKSETSQWAPVPQPFFVFRVSLAGTLHGVSDVRQGRNLNVKPYVKAPFVRAEDDDWDFMPDAGLDFKYGITSGLTLDATVNTDFSQVEADDAQINFTRFSLFFPEKREFFLENAEIFEFGNTGFRSSTRRRTGLSRPGNDLIPFFSRRIGIDDDRVIPILLGGRVTGRAGKYRLGVISMQTGKFEEVPSTNFTVARVRRDVFRSSDIGAIFVNKREVDGYYNRTYGVDTNFTFFRYLELSSYLLGSDTPGLDDGSDSAGFGRIAWRDRLFDVGASYISIQDNFNAEVGFVPRVGVKKTRGTFGLTPRPEGRIPWIREFNPSVNINYVTNQEGVLDTRQTTGRFTVEFNDSSRFTVGGRSTFERLFEDDEILDRPLPAGDYNFGEVSLTYSSDRSRLISGSAVWRDGTYYDGDRRGYGLGLGLFLSSQFGIDLFWDHADIRFPESDLDTDLVSTQIDYSFSTRMFLSGLIQYSSEDGFIASNIRFRWIHNPLSDLYVVYNESRVPWEEVIDRSLIVKLTYNFAF